MVEQKIKWVAYVMQHSTNEAKQQSSHTSVTTSEGWVGCEQCDTITQKEPLQKGETAYCPCCGALLYQQPHALMNLLALTLTALIVFIIANSFPIVMVEVQGNSAQTTLIGAAVAMFKIDRAFVGTLILITTFIVPFINICLLLYILTTVEVLKKRPKFLISAMRLLYVLKTWAMVEVFLIGVLVTLVKLIGMVVVDPGIALWAFAILSVLMVKISSVKIENIWDQIDQRRLQ